MENHYVLLGERIIKILLLSIPILYILENQFSLKFNNKSYILFITIFSSIYLASFSILGYFIIIFAAIPITFAFIYNKMRVRIFNILIIILYITVLIKISEMVTGLLYIFIHIKPELINFVDLLVYCILTVIITKKVKINLDMIFIKEYRKIHIFLLSIIIFILIFYNYLSIYSLLGKEDIPLYYMSIITISVFFILFSSITYNLVKNTKIKSEVKSENQKLEQQKKYILALEKNNNEIRKFKHDFNNIILGLDGYINNDDFNKEKLKKYFNSTIMNFNNNIELNNIVIAKLDSIKVSSLKSLITNKVLVAQNNNIDIDINIQGKINDFYTDEMQLSRVLGILLDNAIEASLELTHDKKIEMNIIQIDKTTDIQISNTFNNTGTPIADFNKEGFSTKDTNRGLGLSSAHEIANKLNMLLNTEIDGNTFVQILTIEGEMYENLNM
ncbi:GHKL domain-containing protein [uncultured Gemella sp.]|uniref:GHKL domain-containing protein n=1 Tax=uncultured Gemella sp. TaxID=254352 RepID=UPI0028D1814A|nr:GHKL domain-containing protein [uncultured Gemella sp.]